MKMLGKRIDWNLESKREQVSANFLFFSNFLSSRFNVSCCLFNVHFYYRVPIEPIKSRNACRKDDTSELIEDVLTRNFIQSFSTCDTKKSYQDVSRHRAISRIKR